MNEQTQAPEPASQPEIETDVLSLLKKMQQQLIFLEKKIDTLIHQSQARPPFGEKTFSRPHRPFGHPQHRPGGRPYEKRQGDGEKSFGYKKHGFEKDREGGSDQKRPFKKWHGGDAAESGPKKKPFYQGFRPKH
jgi:hypothetical protein